MWHSFVRAADWFCLSGRGYQFWSGIGSGSPLVAGVVLVYRSHVCHEPWCPFPSFKPHPEDRDHRVCRLHHRKATKE